MSETTVAPKRFGYRRSGAAGKKKHHQSFIASGLVRGLNGRPVRQGQCQIEEASEKKKRRIRGAGGRKERERGGNPQKENEDRNSDVQVIKGRTQEELDEREGGLDRRKRTKGQRGIRRKGIRQSLLQDNKHARQRQQNRKTFQNRPRKRGKNP